MYFSENFVDLTEDDDSEMLDEYEIEDVDLNYLSKFLKKTFVGETSSVIEISNYETDEKEQIKESFMFESSNTDTVQTQQPEVFEELHDEDYLKEMKDEAQIEEVHKNKLEISTERIEIVPDEIDIVINKEKNLDWSKDRNFSSLPADGCDTNNNTPNELIEKELFEAVGGKSISNNEVIDEEEPGNFFSLNYQIKHYY